MTLVCDPTLLARLRNDLRAASFTVAAIEDLLGPVAAAALHRHQTVPVQLAVSRAAGTPQEPLATLIAVWLLGMPVPNSQMEAALPTLGLAGAETLGLVQVSDQHVAATVDFRPYSLVDAHGVVSWWIASDVGELAAGGPLRPDHVLGAGGASLTLAQITSRDAVGRVLDVGTGCGIQALHAARHAHHVVATDISERALNFTQFNAQLNEVAVELRQGDMLAPVAGELFDLVVSNPPFVITPRGADTIPDYEYRDGGQAGDAIVANVVRHVGTVLAPGGVAYLLGNWEILRGHVWTDRVADWLAESGLDGWVIQRDVLDPAEYVETWLRDGGLTADRDPHAWEQAYRSWLQDFERRNVGAIGLGMIVLRRPADPTAPRMQRLEENLGLVRQPLGPTIAASLAAWSWLAAHDDRALAAARLVRAADVTEERFFTPGAGDPQVVMLRQGTGFGRTVRASTGIAALVGACDGELTVGQIINAIAVLLGVSADDLTAELLPQVRDLILDGFVSIMDHSL